MSDKFILEDGIPVPEPDIYKWAQWFETADRTVAKTVLKDCEVSTVFLGLDHGFGGDEPILYESMIFGGPRDGEQDRYATKEEALNGHTEMVKRAVKT